MERRWYVVARDRQTYTYDADGNVVLLEAQDRSLWDTEQIAAGRAMLDRALALHGRGPRRSGGVCELRDRNRGKDAENYDDHNKLYERKAGLYFHFHFASSQVR